MSTPQSSLLERLKKRQPGGTEPERQDEEQESLLGRLRRRTEQQPDTTRADVPEGDTTKVRLDRPTEPEPEPEQPGLLERARGALGGLAERILPQPTEDRTGLMPDVSGREERRPEPGEVEEAARLAEGLSAPEEVTVPPGTRTGEPAPDFLDPREYERMDPAEMTPEQRVRAQRLEAGESERGPIWEGFSDDEAAMAASALLTGFGMQMPGDIPPERNPVAKGVLSGLLMAGTGIGESMEQAGFELGDEWMSDQGESISDTSRKIIENFGPPPRATEAFASGDPGKMAEWALYAGAQAMGSTLTPIIGGAIGGAVGGPGGAVAGAFIPSYNLMLGEVRGELEQAPDVDPLMKNLVAPIAAIPAAAMETLVPMSVNTRLFAQGMARTTLRMVTTGMGREGVGESLTELGQTFIQQATTAGLSEEEALFTWENTLELVDAAAAGLVGGMGMGGASTLAQGSLAPEGASPEEEAAVRDLLLAQRLGDPVAEADAQDRLNEINPQWLSAEEVAEDEGGPPPSAAGERAQEPEAEEGGPGLRRRLADVIDPSRAEELEEAYRDPTTGLPNKTAFERAKPKLDADPRTRILSFDLTNFKAINDNLGWEAGDRRLQGVADIIREEAEARGIEERDVFRAGGDEFAVAGADEATLQEIGEAVVERVPDLEAGEFTSAVRFGTGDTWLDAEGAAQAEKATEEGPRARDMKAAPEEEPTLEFREPESPEDLGRMQAETLTGERPKDQADRLRGFMDELSEEERKTAFRAYHEHLEQNRERRDTELLESVRERYGDLSELAEPIELDAGDRGSIIVHPSSYEPGRIQATRVQDDIGAVGHDVYDTVEEAILDARRHYGARGPAEPGEAAGRLMQSPEAVGMGEVEPTPTEAPEAAPAAEEAPSRAPAEAPPEAIGRAFLPGTGTVRGTFNVEPTEAIDVEPERFQYKDRTNEEGVTQEFKEVEAWDPVAAGHVVVWRDPADNRLKVVNGHHRVELARRLGVEDLKVVELDPEAVPDAGTARMVGALTNIREGKGTPIDAAKVFREGGFAEDHLREMGISLTSQVGGAGLALSKLHPTLFKEVATERVKWRRMLPFGEADLTEDQQLALWRLVQREERSGKRLRNDEIEELARFVHGAGTEEVSQETLFGTETRDESLALDKARLSRWVKEQLREEKRTFQFLTKKDRAGRIERKGAGSIEEGVAEEVGGEAARLLEIYDRLSTRAGPVSDALNRAVRELRGGANEQTVREGLLENVREAILEEVSGRPGDRGGEGPGSERVPESGAVPEEPGLGLEEGVEPAAPTEAQEAYQALKGELTTTRKMTEGEAQTAITMLLRKGSPEGILREAQHPAAERLLQAVEKDPSIDPSNELFSIGSLEVREEAPAYEARRGVDLPEDFQPGEFTPEEGEEIVSAYVKVGDEEAEGPSHFQAVRQLIERDVDVEGISESEGTVFAGYRTSTGRVINRVQAGKGYPDLSHGWPRLSSEQVPALRRDPDRFEGVEERPPAYRTGMSGADAVLDTAERMRRAEEQGFDTDRVLYHGTLSPTDFEGFQPWSHFGSTKAANAILDYKGQWGAPLSDRRIIPVVIRGDYLEVEDGKGWRTKEVLAQARDRGVITQEEMDEALTRPREILPEGMTPEEQQLFAETAPGLMSQETKDRVAALLKSKGYHGVKYKNLIESPGEMSYLVFDPKDVRSVNARFEPGMEESPDLLAERPPAYGDKYPRVGEAVDGRTVGDRVANRASIEASLGYEDYRVLPGIREVPMSVFEVTDPSDLFYASDDVRRTRKLAEAIRESGRVDPLIVVEDEEGAYVLEGAHRLGALHILGAESFPALVVEVPPPSAVREEEPTYEAGEGRPDLRATHNTTRAGLRFALQMGGIPNPSLAVHRADQPFTTMGEVSLVAPRSIVDPATGDVRVYDADVFSARTPERQFDTTEETKGLFQEIQDERRRLEGVGGVDVAMEDLVKGREPSAVASSLAHSLAGRSIYLREAHGIEVEPTMGPPRYTSPAFDSEPVQRFLEGLDQRVSEIDNRSPEHRAYSETVREGLLQQYEEAGLEDAVDLAGTAFNDEGLIPWGRLQRLVRDVEKQREGEEFHTSETRAELDELIEEHGGREAAQEWWEERVLDTYDEPYFLTSHARPKRQPYTLENVSAEMRRQSGRAVEQTMTFGPGKARAAASRDVESVEDFEGFRGSLTERERVQEAKDAQEALREEVSEGLLPYHPDPHDSTFGAVWETLNDLHRAVAILGQKGRGTRTSAGARSALVEAGFQAGVPDEVVESFMDYADLILDAPTQYLEAKMERPVGLDEFSGVVVPDDTSADLIAALEERGLTVETYPLHDDEARTEALNRVTGRTPDEMTVFERGPSYDLFGEPIEEETQQGELMGGGPEGQTETLNKARATMSRLQAKVEAGAASDREIQRYHDARATVRALEGRGVDEEELAERARREGVEERDEEVGDLFEGESRERPPSYIYPPKSQRLSTNPYIDVIAADAAQGDDAAIVLAARAMAVEVPAGAALVPLPDDTGANAKLARATAAIAGVEAADVLERTDEGFALKEGMAVPGKRPVFVTTRLTPETDAAGAQAAVNVGEGEPEVLAWAHTPETQGRVREGPGGQVVGTIGRDDAPSIIRDIRSELDRAFPAEEEGAESDNAFYMANVIHMLENVGASATEVLNEFHPDLDTPAMRDALERAQRVVEAGGSLIGEPVPRTPADMDSQLESTHGSKTAAKRFNKDFAKTAGDLAQASIPGVTMTEERIRAVEKGREAGYYWVSATGHDLTGEKVGEHVTFRDLEHETVYKLLRSYRHPSAEYFHALVVDNFGRVIYHRMISSGNVNMAEINTLDLMEPAALAAKTRGGRVIFAHNHPSGKPNPSKEDRTMTKKMVRIAQALGADFGGHFVIDSEDATVINQYGEDEAVHVPREDMTRDWADLSSKEAVTSPQDVFDYAAQLPMDEKRVDILLLDGHHHIAAWEAKTQAEMANIAEWLPALLRDTATVRIVVATHGRDAYEGALDVLDGQPLPVLDVVDSKLNRSAGARGEITLGEGSETAVTTNPIFERPENHYTVKEEAPAYGPHGISPEARRSPDFGPGGKRAGPRDRARQQQERFIADAQELYALAERVNNLPQMELEFTDRVQATMEAAFGRRDFEEQVEQKIMPKQVKDIMDQLRATEDTREAWRLIRRAARVLESRARKKAIRDLQNELKRAYKGEVRPEFLEEIEAVVEDIDVESLTPKTRRSLRSTARYLEENEDASVPPEVVERLKALEKKRLSRMDPTEIIEMVDAVRNALHLNKTKNRMLGRQRRKKSDEMAGKAVSEMKERVKPLKRRTDVGLVGRLLGKEGLELKPKASGIGYFFREFGARPEVLLEHLSPTLQRLVYEDVTVRGHHEAERLKWQFTDEIRAAYTEATGHAVPSKAFEDWRRETLELQAPDGIVQITRDEAIWLLTTMKDPSNRRFMHKNGVTIARSDRQVGWDDATEAELLALTGKTENDIATRLHELFNGSMKEALNEAWVEVHGYEIATEPDYAPRMIDMDRRATGKDALEEMAAAFQMSLEGWGHLRQRVGTGAPLKIGAAMDVVVNHSGHVSRIAGYLAPWRNVQKILGRVDVKQAIIQRIGKKGYERILESVQLQAVQYHPGARGDEALRNRLRMFGGAILGVRLSPLLKNPAGLAVSAAYQAEGWRNLAKAFPGAQNPAEWERVIGLAKKHAPYWRTRYEHFVYQSTGGMAGERRNQYGRPDLPSLSLEPLQFSDKFGAVVRWRMAEEYVRRNHKAKEEGTDEFYEAVAQEWMKLMFRGENTGHGGDMTGALAKGRTSPWFAPFVMFYSSASKLYSLGLDAKLTAQRGEGRAATRKAAAFMMSLGWLAFVSEVMLRTLKGEDDDEDEEGGAVQRIIDKMATDAATLVPIFGNVIAAGIRRWQGKPTVVFEASAVEGFLADAGGTLMDGITALEAAMANEVGDADEEKAAEYALEFLKGSADLAAQWFGLPLPAIGEYGKWVQNWMPDATGDQREELRQVRSQLEALEDRADLSTERNALFDALILNDDQRFREAVGAMREKGERVSGSEILATVNRRYGFLTKYEPGKDAREGLTPEARALIDRHLEDRDNLRAIAETLVEEHADLIDADTRRRGGRRRRSPRRRRRRR